MKLLKKNLVRSNRVHLIYTPYSYSRLLHLSGFGPGYYIPKHKTHRIIVVNCIENKYEQNGDSFFTYTDKEYFIYNPHIIGQFTQR